jgi:hypothetical protein
MPISRVTFASGQYVTGQESTAFDAVARAISGGGDVLRSRKVLLVELVDDIDGLMSYPEVRDLVQRYVSSVH